MYSPKIYDNQVESLYKIRCVYAAMGERITMVDLVAESLGKYLPRKTREVNKKAIGMGIFVAPAVPQE